MCHDLGEMRCIFALALRRPLRTGCSLFPLARNRSVSASRMITKEPAQRVEALGVGAVEDLGRLHGGEPKRALIKLCFRRPVELR